MKNVLTKSLISSMLIVTTIGAEIPEGMVLIPGGTNSGSDPDRYYSLTVTAFYIDSTEVTKLQWDTIYNWAVTNGYNFDNPGIGRATNHPVHSVNWYDCVKWCNARSDMEGRTPCYTVGGNTYKTGQYNPGYDSNVNGFRLPTETEWKYAARGGLVGLRFPWGDTITHSNANYWASYYYIDYEVSTFRGPHPSYDDGEYPYTSPVGSFPANGYGLYDMTGNVWEWCWNSYGSSRGRMGSSWYTNPINGRCGSSMIWTYPGGAGMTYGFRTVCRD